MSTKKEIEKILNGEIPVTSNILIELIYSHGSINKNLPKKECYDLSKLDTSEITNMDNLFNEILFDGDISNWNTSNVTSMEGIFFNATIFNGNISQWDVSKVTSMKKMFLGAEKFNQNIGDWDISNVTSVNSMFYYAHSFNQSIGNWNTSKVISMDSIFYNAIEFNQPLNWNTSNVTNMSYMFYKAKSFEQPLKFDLSKIKTMEFAFEEALKFQEKYNNNNPLPKDTIKAIEWVNNNKEIMNFISINNKINNNQKSFDNLIKEKNIQIDSPLYKELLDLYNNTQDKLKNDLNLNEDIKKEVVEIATNDFLFR